MSSIEAEIKPKRKYTKKAKEPEPEPETEPEQLSDDGLRPSSKADPRGRPLRELLAPEPDQIQTTPIKKEKKPRTEKQKEAFQRMLQAKRDRHNELLDLRDIEKGQDKIEKIEEKIEEKLSVISKKRGSKRVPDNELPNRYLTTDASRVLVARLTQEGDRSGSSQSSGDISISERDLVPDKPILRREPTIRNQVSTVRPIVFM